MSRSPEDRENADSRINAGFAVSPRDIEDWAIQSRLKEQFSTLEKITDKWGFIRQAYMERMPDIFTSSRQRLRSMISPYFIDWIVTFSPIEQIAWHSIRSKGVPLYPQFPLFNYFIDFANPFLRIGLELDGKDWHDSEKDRQRDQVLSSYGWRIFRVPGSEATGAFELPIELDERGASAEEKDEAIHKWLLTTCDGVVAAIDYVYFRQLPEEFDGLCLRTLDCHRLASFELLPSTND